MKRACIIFDYQVLYSHERLDAPLIQPFVLYILAIWESPEREKKNEGVRQARAAQHSHIFTHYIPRQLLKEQ